MKLKLHSLQSFFFKKIITSLQSKHYYSNSSNRFISILRDAWGRCLARKSIMAQKWSLLTVWRTTKWKTKNEKLFDDYTRAIFSNSREQSTMQPIGFCVRIDWFASFQRFFHCRFVAFLHTLLLRVLRRPAAMLLWHLTMVASRLHRFQRLFGSSCEWNRSTDKGDLRWNIQRFIYWIWQKKKETQQTWLFECFLCLIVTARHLSFFFYSTARKIN